jgi:5'-3' exonuclease
VSAIAEAPPVTELALIDLSSIAYPIWMMSGSQPDPDYTSTQIVARIRSLAATHPKAAICCDSGRSFRHDINPTYKAQREAAPAALHHQIALAKERLAADGFPVWSVKGFEADDLIATATAFALLIPGVSVLVLSADKDLLQLVGPRVRAMSTTNGTVYDAAAVTAKFGVRPDQMRDYLALVGDAADNVKGAAGIGAKKAAALLSEYGTLEGVYFALAKHGTAFKPAMASALREFEPRMAETRSLITLRTDAPVPLSDLDQERTAKDAPAMEDEMSEPSEVEAVNVAAGDVVTIQGVHGAHVVSDPVPPIATPSNGNGHAPAAPVTNGNGQHVPVATADSLAPAPAEFSMQLEPRSLGQASSLAKAMFESRLFSAYGTPHAVLSTILAGRELGLQAMASLRAFHIVEGKHMMSADLLRALVLRSGKAKYFRCTERTAARATFVTQRDDDPPMTLTYTIEEAEQAGLVKDKSGWKKNPADMLIARAGSKLARLVYPEVVHGLYAPEEFGD